MATEVDNRATMFRRLLSLLILAGIPPVLAVLACGRTASTPTPDTEYPKIEIVNCDGSPVEGRPWRQATREDGLLSHLAERIPGFGGLFLADEELAVYLMDLDTAQRAKPTLDWFLHRELPHLLDRANDIHWLQGQYDWRQLAVWRECLGGRMFAQGATGIDIDEGRNRVTIGTPAEERDSILEGELAKTAVPRNAVIFRRRGLVCPLPLGPSVVVEIRDGQGEPAAIGATVTIRKPGVDVSDEGFRDPLRVEMFANNEGGGFEVRVSKPWHGEVVLPSVEVPEGPCGMLESKVVQVTVELLPEAPPVRQVVLPPRTHQAVSPSMEFWFRPAACGKRSEVPVYLLADPDVRKDLRWVSRDPSVVTVEPGETSPDGSIGGWIIPLCRGTPRATHVVAMAAADSTVRDSIEVSVLTEESSPIHCFRDRCIRS